MRVTVNFSLDPKEDADLLTWLRALPKRQRSAAIREALRRDRSNEVQLADVLMAIHDLGARLQRVSVVPAEGGAPSIEEPPEAAAALDDLGL